MQSQTYRCEELSRIMVNSDICFASREPVVDHRSGVFVFGLCFVCPVECWRGRGPRRVTSAAVLLVPPGHGAFSLSSFCLIL